MATKKDNVPEEKAAVPEAAAPAPVVPEASVAPSLIAFDTFVVGKFGTKRERFTPFAGYMRRIDPKVARTRKTQAEWEAEYTKFLNRPIGG
jgi:hypothetical protein